MADSKHTKDVVTVLILCILWYIISSSNSVVGKLLLSEFPYPMTVTMVQLLSITVYSGPVFKCWGVRKSVDISWRYYWKIIIPLAFGKFFASVASHMSIWKVPVSYAHTVKATMPLFTVFLSRIIMGERQTSMVYMSLVPIITGVAIATMTELRFDLVGLLSALASTMGFSLQNIFSKKTLHDTGIHHFHLLQLLGRLALIMFTPIWFLFDFFRILEDPVLFSGNHKVITLLITDGVLNWLQNIVAFSVMSIVTPLTYAVASASKRIFVIALSLFILGNPVTIVNIFGMMLAVFGVLFYNKAKYDQKHEKKRDTLLPLSQAYSHTNHVLNNSLLYPSEPTIHSNGGFSNGVVVSKGQNGKLNGGTNSNNFLYNTSGSNSKLLFV